MAIKVNFNPRDTKLLERMDMMKTEERRAGNLINTVSSSEDKSFQNDGKNKIK